MSDQHGVTRLLLHWQEGDREALDELMPILYEELKSLAAAQVRRDSSATIQCTELVAEAYLRLVEVERVDFQGRNHFYSLAARTMRRVLVDRYRVRSAAKRGDSPTLLTLADGDGLGREVALDRLDDALIDLEKLDRRQAEIVTLKFFGGLSARETAALLAVSERTIKREWAFARRWLFRELAL